MVAEALRILEYEGNISYPQSCSSSPADRESTESWTNLSYSMETGESILLSKIPVGETNTPILAVATPAVNVFLSDLITGDKAREVGFRLAFFFYIWSEALLSLKKLSSYSSSNIPLVLLDKF